MEEVNPREFDPELIHPDPDAEAIAALTFLLELPHCLRINELTFLVSDHGKGWAGWSPDAIGYLAEMAPVPPGVEPRYRVELKQLRVDNAVPLAAAEEAFPQWHGLGGPTRKPGVTERGRGELRSVALLTVYDRLENTPLESEKPDEAFKAEVGEWLSRRFDEALGFLNLYVVVLASLHDEWHISSISRSELPRDLPWKLRLHPTPEGWNDPSATLDIQATLRDDLPEERPQDEVAAAVNLVHEARAGRIPFFQFLELYQASEHHLGSGRNDQSVIAATTATEVLINTLFRVLWVLLERDPQKLGGVLRAPFKNQLTHHLASFLDASVDLEDSSSPPGRWHEDCYLLRNRVVHEGHKATAAEAYDAKISTGAFSHWIGEHMPADSRSNSVRSFLTKGAISS